MFELEERGSNRRWGEIVLWGGPWYGLLGKYWSDQNQKDEKSGVCGMLCFQFLAQMFAILTDIFRGFPLFFQALMILPLMSTTCLSVYHSVILLYSTTLCSGEDVKHYIPYLLV